MKLLQALLLTTTVLLCTQETFAMCAMPNHSLCQELELEINSCKQVQGPFSAPAANEVLEKSLVFSVEAKIIKSKGISCNSGTRQESNLGDHPTGKTEKFGIASTSPDYCKDLTGTKIVQVEENCCDTIGRTCFTYWITKVVR